MCLNIEQNKNLAHIITMVIRNVGVPDNVYRYVVTYVFENWTSHIMRRRNYFNVVEAEECYERGCKFIGSSKDFEKVGFYYQLEGSGDLHLIESYDTVWGYKKAGEQT